jgi:arabinogalactan endo-1,4-beta-galactosidase
MKVYWFLIYGLIFSTSLAGQTFYFGNDLSYVNEMEDCGVIYKENKIPKDPYRIFADHGGNLVRLRLWKNPSWYKTINSGKIYSDFTDVARSIKRAHQHNMQVLLDFHLSDNWADPSKQLVPLAWEPVVNNLPVLKDSLYRYIYSTLFELHQLSLLPEMVQIGNETNKGILLSPADNLKFTLDWTRNATLFNAAIQAVRDIEKLTNKTIRIGIHAAGPKDTGWLIDQFIEHGVTDFDVIGISYYWAWHKPSSIQETGTLIKSLKSKHAKEVMIFETGYIWTTESQDQANNIISEVHPDYSPASPGNQKKWLIDLTREVLKNNGSGVIYWEPAWVSSNCFTQWGKGSHQEHATFFDFQQNLIDTGGIQWMSHDYHSTVSLQSLESKQEVTIHVDTPSQQLRIWVKDPGVEIDVIHIYDLKGSRVYSAVPNREGEYYSIPFPTLPHSIYIVEARDKKHNWYRQKIGF